MPYIKKDERLVYDDAISNIIKKIKTQVDINSESILPGHLNYIITRLLSDVHFKVNDKKINRNYSDYNSIIGMLECCKLEFYRKQVAPYEEKKIWDNGDVKPNK